MSGKALLEELMRVTRSHDAERRRDAAMVRGVQRRNVIACVKHFAFNSRENAKLKRYGPDCLRGSISLWAGRRAA